jgi:hypothetical protein
VGKQGVGNFLRAVAVDVVFLQLCNGRSEDALPFEIGLYCYDLA